MEFLSKHSTINSPLLKIIVTVLFIILPFLGFFLGVKYQTSVNESQEVPTTPIRKPTLAPKQGIDETASQIPTDNLADLKTYTNTKYGYVLKYPSNYKITSCRNCLDLATVDYINITSPKSSYNNKGYGFITVSVINPPTNQILNLSKITISKGITAYTETVVRSAYETKHVNIPKNGKVISFEFSGIDSPLNQNIPITNLADYSTFLQILSTFKFTDQNQIDETSNWKTYTNEKYGFEFKYPNDYFISELEDGISIADNKWIDELVHHPYLAFQVTETKISPEEWVSQEIKGLKDARYGIIEEGCYAHCVSKEASTIIVGNNIKGFQYSEWGASGGNDIIVIAKDENNGWLVQIFNHKAGSRAPDDVEIPQDIVTQILSTFRFTQ